MSRHRNALARMDADAELEAEEANAQELLAFELAAEHYTLPLSCIREIMRVPAVTEVPRAPHAVLGVISARGAVTTLIDLRRRLRLPEAPIGSRTRVLLVQHSDEVLGLLVDAVLQVYRLMPSEIELANALGGSAPAHLVGIGRPGLRNADPAAAHALLLLLDPALLMTLDRSPAR